MTSKYTYSRNKQGILIAYDKDGNIAGEVHDAGVLDAKKTNVFSKLTKENIITTLAEEPEIFKKYITTKYRDGTYTLRPTTPKTVKDKFLKIMSVEENTLCELIPKPCAEDAELYLNVRNNDQQTMEQEKALSLLFTTIMPKNTNVYEIILKAASLNSFYSTNIHNFFAVAEHILGIKDFDVRIAQGDSSLINEFRDVQIETDKKRFLYSFATKYCSFHNPDAYHIYDRYIDKLLCYFKANSGFTSRRVAYEELRNYSNFKNVLEDFQKYFGLQAYSAKELDIYLWQFGKDYYAFL